MATTHIRAHPSAIAIFCRDLTCEQLFSIYNKAKVKKRAFTSFRFRNRSEAQSSGFSENEGQTFCYILLLSENPKRINHVMAKLETEQKRWMQVPLCNKRKVCTQN